MEEYSAPSGQCGACESSWEMTKAAPIMALREHKPAERRCAEVWRVPPRCVKTRRKSLLLLYRCEPSSGASRTRCLRDFEVARRNRALVLSTNFFVQTFLQE